MRLTMLCSIVVTPVFIKSQSTDMTLKVTFILSPRSPITRTVGPLNQTWILMTTKLRLAQNDLWNNRACPCGIFFSARITEIALSSLRTRLKQLWNDKQISKSQSRKALRWKSSKSTVQQWTTTYGLYIILQAYFT